jgi:ferrochelatase
VAEIGNIGVLLLNLGGPDSVQAVRPFLYNLFSDRKIIKLGPPFLQKPLAWLISTLRSGKTEAMYRLIGGKSPILDITRAQADALEKVLNGESAVSPSPLAPRPLPFFRVYVGMRYWSPFIEDTVRQMRDDGIRSVLAMSLYPHYSLATTGSAMERFEEVIRQYPMESSSIPSWYDHPLYVESLAESIRRGLELFGDGAEVLFSAHSLPMSIVEAGDPYVSHIEATIGAVVRKTGCRWHLSYQSKSGPVKWLEPSTEEKIKELAGRGVKDLLVVPISFVSDHIETLYEIDILYKRLAEKVGIRLLRAQSLNTSPLFIGALKEMVMTKTRELGWTG